tara:strand:- start:872 stop:1147 length:276 start_codon:yes stop_codon:yes gene_type:complete
MTEDYLMNMVNAILPPYLTAELTDAPEYHASKLTILNSDGEEVGGTLVESRYLAPQANEVEDMQVWLIRHNIAVNVIPDAMREQGRRREVA